MNPEEQVLLTTVFEALGPERVTRGLKATGHRWNDCFLAIATYGEPDALAREMEKSHRGERTSSHLFTELVPPATLLDGVKCIIATWSAKQTPAVQERGTT